MTTPVTFQTAARIIRTAYQDAGLVQEGQTLGATKLADGMMRLTDLINYFQTRGIKLWLWTDLSITLTQGKSLYTLGPGGDVVMTKPLRGVQGYFLDTSNNRTPLSLISQKEWWELSQITQQGAVNSFYVDKQLNTLNVNIWNSPDATAATGTVHVLLEQQVTGPVSFTDTMYFPVEWYMPLRWGLAEDLSSGQPDSIVAKCTANATRYRIELEDWDVEDASTSFAPDMRGQYGTSDFR